MSQVFPYFVLLLLCVYVDYNETTTSFSSTNDPKTRHRLLKGEVQVGGTSHRLIGQFNDERDPEYVPPSTQPRNQLLETLEELPKKWRPA